jgi:drug/metabolite transporter (DMT)-like permease
MPRPARISDWVALFALTVLWGSAFLLNEIALGALPPNVIVAGRIIIATGVLFAAMHAHGISLPGELRGWLPMFAMAVFGNVLPFTLIAWAQQFISSSLAGILMAVMPLFVLTLAHFFLPGGRMTPKRAVGFFAGFIGVSVVIGPDALSYDSSSLALWGALATLGAALSYSISAIIARRMRAAEPLQVSVGMLLLSSVLAAPGAALDLATPIEVSWPALMALCALGLLSTGYATVLYFRLVQGPGPAFLSFVNYLVPAWAVLAGWAFLNETLSVSVFVGLALILVGIAVSELWPPDASALRSALGRRGVVLPARIAKERG